MAQPPLYMPNPLLKWLFARQHFMTPDFARVERLLSRLGRPQDSFDSILITGTNGKGSTSSSLHSIVHAAGIRTGRFTSPHLSYFAERFVVDNAMLNPDHVLEALAAIQPLAEQEDNSFFEIVTALACLLFAEQGVKFAVMEIGMGGQFDTTNVLEPILSLITNISLDHTRYLGETVADIAATKAHIMRPQRPCYTTATAGIDILREHAKTIGASLHRVDYAYTLQGWDGVKVTCQGIQAHSPLVGEHQAANVALAMAAGKQLGVADEAIARGVAATVWAGRLEKLHYRGRDVVLDGAHNPASAKALVQALRDLGVQQALVIFGCNADKDLSSIAPSIDRIAAQVILTQAQYSPKASPPEAMQAAFSSPSLCIAQPTEALDYALAHSRPEQCIVIAGSLYLVGEMRPLLLEAPREPWERWQ